MAEKEKNQKSEQSQSTSELRRDIVSQDWVVISTGRAKRPHDAHREWSTHNPDFTKKEGCPFEDPQASGNEAPIFALDRKGKKLPEDTFAKDWFVQVLPNKYPALTPQTLGYSMRGPYGVMPGAGFHELVIMRDHERHWGHYTKEEAYAIVKSYQMRYAYLAEDEIVNYVSLFHNYGKEAGASIFHPHSQIIAIPVVPADVRRSLTGSARYFEENGSCAHCTIIEWERSEQVRVIKENDAFVAICPFTSRSAFEIRVYPLRHEAHFGGADEKELALFGEILNDIGALLRDNLGGPSFNFYIHTSPRRDGNVFPHYHWHLELIPKISIWAGFEVATGIEISTIAPERAAAFLRSGESPDQGDA